MRLQWTSKSRGDLERLHRFLAKKFPKTAAREIQLIAASPDRLIAHPRIGERLEGFSSREVRRIFVGPYELRYEIRLKTIVVLRVWHGRENR